MFILTALNLPSFNQMIGMLLKPIIGQMMEVVGDMSGGTFVGTVYLTVADVAAALKVSKMTIYRQIRSGALPAAQFGRSFRISEADMNGYVKKAETAHSEPSQGHL